ncbi:MAG: 8-amino-7-oxononanoate synthase [Thermoflavifilum sp.]|nr:8-amino-7-oxononanoate synthase [Thermoflavifilum sp.]
MYAAYFEQWLAERKQQDAFRQLQHPQGIDFCSNDYIGLAHDPVFQESITHWIAQHRLSHGSTGSRLLSGHHPFYDQVEQAIADFHQASSALIFASGYMANLALMSALPQRGDWVLYDQLIHASLRDGLRMSLAHHRSFPHNDLDTLEKLLQQIRAQHGQKRIWVVVESVYSMDGDQPNLIDLSRLCQHYAAALIVDEAHAVGVIGQKGEGLVQMQGLAQACLARIVTFGKALGAHGAAVLGEEWLKQYLLNAARPQIYSTALPPATLAAIYLAYQQIPAMQAQRAHVANLSALFRQQMSLPTSPITPIQAIRIPGNSHVKACGRHLQAAGFDVRPILHPTVPRGEERLRVVLHSFNSETEVMGLTQALHEWLRQHPATSI